MVPLLFSVFLFSDVSPFAHCVTALTSPDRDEQEAIRICNKSESVMNAQRAYVAYQTKITEPAPIPQGLKPSPVYRPVLRHKGLQGALITMSVGLGLTAVSIGAGANCKFGGCTVPEVLFVTAAPVAIIAGIIAIVDACRDPQ